jgi:hypothetical protein
MWIIQEAINATDLVLVYGSEYFLWHTFAMTCWFLLVTQWDQILSPAYLRIYLDSTDVPDILQKTLAYEREPGNSAMELFRTRNAIVDYEQEFTLYELLQTHRTCLATDPREKIYALLGIIKKDSLEFVKSTQLNHVDYTIPVVDLYINVAWAILLSTGDLRILHDKEEENGSKVIGLPSWVPDWSCDWIHAPIDRGGTAPWRTHSNRPCSLSLSLNKHFLSVRGICISKIESVSQESQATGEFWASLCTFLKEFSSSATATDRLEIFTRTITCNRFAADGPCGNEYCKAIIAFIL